MTKEKVHIKINCDDFSAIFPLYFEEGNLVQFIYTLSSQTKRGKKVDGVNIDGPIL